MNSESDQEQIPIDPNAPYDAYYNIKIDDDGNSEVTEVKPHCPCGYSIPALQGYEITSGECPSCGKEFSNE